MVTGSSRGVGSWAFMLRDAELSALRAALGSDERPTVLVAGEAGVGKSALANHALSGYVADGGSGRRCMASASLREVPFGTLVGLIPAHHMAAVAAGTQQLSVLAMMLEHIVGCGATDEQPFIIYIDDVHHLDDASCGLLQQLCAIGPVQLLLTLRSGEALPAGVASLWRSPDTVRVPLEPFTRADIDEIVQSVMGEAAPEVREALWQRSQGNALYLRELVVGSVAAGRIALHGGTWVLVQPLVGSPHLDEYLLQTVRSLGPDPRHLADMLALCQPLPLAMFTPAEQSLIEQLVATGIATMSGEVADLDVGLSHPIFADVLRSRQTVLTQRAVLAEVVARIGPHQRSGDDLRLTVWQLDGGGAPSVDALVRAARAAMTARDLLLAARLTRAAQAIEPHHPMASLVLSDALYEMGDFAGSAAETTAALGVATDPNEQGLLVASLYRAYLWGLDDADGALAVVDFALAVTPDGAAHDFLTVAAANALSFSDRPGAAHDRLATLDGRAKSVEGSLYQPVYEATVTQLGRTAEATAEPLLEGSHALHTVVRSFALTEHGCFEEAATLGQNLRSDVIGLALTLDQMWAALNAGRAHLMAGRPRTALLWAGDAMIIAERAGLISGQSLIVSVLAAAHAQLGDREATEAVDQRALELAEVRGFLRAERAVGRAWAAALRHERTKALAMLAEGADAARSAGQLVSESFLLTEIIRLDGEADADRLAQLAASSQSPLVAARAAFARGARAGDPTLLAAAGEQLAQIGASLVAAEAFAVAQRLSTGRAAAAHGTRAQALRELCEGAVTPLLQGPAVGGLAQLTAREREVAALAVEGFSAREIGERLFLSVRTVENHVQRIYTKLGATSRKDLQRCLAGD